MSPVSCIRYQGLDLGTLSAEISEFSGLFSGISVVFGGNIGGNGNGMSVFFNVFNGISGFSVADVVGVLGLDVTVDEVFVMFVIAGSSDDCFVDGPLVVSGGLVGKFKGFLVDIVSGDDEEFMADW